MTEERSLLCPSAQPGMQGPRLLGVVEATADGARLVYLNEDVPVTPELLAQAGPARPTEVFRFAANCEANKCVHFRGERCTLVTRIVQILPIVVDALPVCLIRSNCRWYGQEAREACLRCPQIVTETSEVSDDYRRAALPEVVNDSVPAAEHET
jgi:hypothetical protein